MLALSIAVLHDCKCYSNFDSVSILCCSTGRFGGVKSRRLRVKCQNYFFNDEYKRPMTFSVR